MALYKNTFFRSKRYCHNYLFFDWKTNREPTGKENLLVTKNTLGPGVAMMLGWPSQVSPGEVAD